MRQIFFLLLIYFALLLTGTLYADNEIQLIEKFLQRPYSRNVIKTGKLLIKADRQFDPYMKNPVFSMSLEKSFSDTAYAFKFASIGLEFDVSGRYFLQKEAAQFNKLSSQERLKTTVLNNVAGFRALLAKLFYLNQKKQVLTNLQKEIETLLKEVSELVDGKNKSDFDLLRIRALSLSHKRKLLLTTSEIMALNAQLTQLCGVEVKKIDLTLPTLMSYEQIKSRALASNPFIKEAKLQISATEANFISAKRKRIPDLGVNVGFIKEKIPSSPSEYSVDVGLSFDLPVFNFNKKEIANTAYENQQKKMDLYEKERLLELQLIELHTKTKLLKQGAAVSYKKGEIAEKAFFIYRKGESTVNDLISTLHDVEEISISEIELNETIHYLTLELYAVAGFFENESINDTILGALK